MGEAFVWIHLALSHTPVLAGHLRHDADAGRGEFAYDAAYLARPDALELDPVELPLSDATFETDRLGGVFGALRDAGPDHWSRSLLDAQAQPGTLDEFGYLLAAPGDRAGARRLAPARSSGSERFPPPNSGNPGASVAAVSAAARTAVCATAGLSARREPASM